MSNPIATVADALIEFILSLLRDPAAREVFERDPEGALQAQGLGRLSAADVCSVAPVIYDRPDVVPHVAPKVVTPSRPHESETVREVKSILNQMTYVTNNTSIHNNNTIVDQSVNQNIWTDGDVLQVFDQSAVVSTGEGSLAVGGDVTIDGSQDSSTTIIAGNDAAVGNALDVVVTENSYNEATNAPATHTQVEVEVEDSFNDSHTAIVNTDDSFNQTSMLSDETSISIDNDTTVTYDDPGEGEF
ncbi:MAG: IniB N-terminal domain-containing protein [Nigerium sp.]|nr:IniB N-terminal domain-containing protein [Nigerium sp.]